jgi:hypothetical protein
MKTCTKCHETKDKNLFHFDKRLNKFYAACRICTKIHKDNLYKRNGDKYRAQRKIKNQSPKGRFQRIKDDSKQRGIKFLIPEEKFYELIKEPCYYCDNKLGTKTIYGVGLDRLDSSKAYEYSNVVPCCHFCNTTKSYLLTVEEMKIVAKLLISLRGDALPVSAIDIKNDLIKSRKSTLANR